MGLDPSHRRCVRLLADSKLARSILMLLISSPAVAQIAEFERTANWVLAIFSPALLLALLTLVLIGAGVALLLGRLSGELFVRILIGTVLVFGAPAIAPRIAALFRAAA